MKLDEQNFQRFLTACRRDPHGNIAGRAMLELWRVTTRLRRVAETLARQPKNKQLAKRAEEWRDVARAAEEYLDVDFVQDTCERLGFGRRPRP